MVSSRSGEKKTGKIISFLFVAILILQLGLYFYLGTQKTNLNCDEIYTYGLANNKGSFWDVNERDVWRDRVFYINYLTAEEGAKFDYSSVYENQVLDTHPPVFFYMFHTVSSFSPGVFSKWIGIGLNMFLYIFIYALLYKLTRGITGSGVCALITVFFYGFTLASSDEVLFIRMYVLLTLMCVALVYLHYLLFFGKNRLLTLLAITAVTFTGSLSHYFYIPFAFVVSAVTCFYILFDIKGVLKSKKTLLLYPFSELAGVFLAYLYFPAMKTHLFGGMRGTQAIGNFFGSLSEFFTKPKIYLDFINRELFGNLLLYVVISQLALAAAVIILKKYVKPKDMSQEEKGRLIFFAALFVCTAGYIVGISKAAQLTLSRYIMGVYPFVTVIISVITWRLLSLLTPNKVLKTCICSLIALACCLSSLYWYTTFGYQLSQAYYVATDSAEQYSDYDCIFITNTGEYMATEVPSLMKFEATYGLSQNMIDTLPALLEERGVKDNLVVYFGFHDYEKYAEEVLKYTDYDYYELLNYYNWPMVLFGTQPTVD